MHNVVGMKRHKEFNRRRVFLIIVLVFLIIYHWRISTRYKNSSVQRTIQSLLMSDTSTENKKQDIFQAKINFLKDWSEVAKSRRNFSHVMAKCNIDWKKEEAVPWFMKKTRTDLDKTYVSSMEINPAGEYSSVTLQTQFVNGTLKHCGGDYWRVFVRGSSAVPVLKTDLGNGTYIFKFLPMHAGNYLIKISLEYTLCDGVKQPPPDWFIRGNIQGKDQLQGILAKDMPFINKPLWKDADISFKVIKRRFKKIEYSSLIKEVCTGEQGECRYLWNAYGSWINKTTWTPLCKDVNFRYPRKKQGVLWIFGDSVSSQFYHRIKLNKICKQIFRTCMYSYNWVYSLENYNISMKSYVRKNTTIQKTIWNTLDFNATQVIIELKQALLNPSMDEKSAILFNYGLHYTESANFTNFKKVIQEVVKLRKYVRCKMIWRTTTSLNRHKYTRPNLHSRRFMTSHRVQLYNAYATNEFCKAGFDILDIYPLTDSYPDGTGNVKFPHDPVHYEYHVMKPMETVLERVFGE